MGRCNKKHMELDDDGRGLCSVPMWMGGMPCGFCDNGAFGERVNSSAYTGYVPFLACPIHGGPKSRVFKDGNQWCAVYADFTNLQESPAGFGDTPEEARSNLKHGK